MTLTDRAASSRTEAVSGRPKLLFFRPTRGDLPEFVNVHLREHVRALEHSFEVALVTGDADFDEVVDREQPDLVLFESGVYVRPDRRITGTHRHPEIPRLGLLNADAYCLTRSVFLSDMDDWGVDTFFTIGAATPAHTPDIADRLFVWPNFADRSVFHTYPGGKSVSILLAGSRRSHYPWRVKVDRVLADRFPVRSLPHAGWFDRGAASEMPTGEDWARTLSAAQIVPTCGTFADDLVRKHLEIPAAGALLLTERTPVVEAAGFIDMENAVFADEADAADKVEYLLAHPDVLDRITAAGQRLVHERHDISTRDQMLQWFDLHLARRPGQVITQPTLFGPLELRERGVGALVASAGSVPGSDELLVREADRDLRLDRVGSAAAGYAGVLNRHLEPEAALGLARTYLRSGEPAAAADLLWFLIDRTVNVHGARRPDPVEWATYLRSLLATGREAEAARLAERFPALGHPELQRMRHVVAVLAGSDVVVGGQAGGHSVHPSPATTWDAWRADLVTDLRACAERELAERVVRIAAPVGGRPAAGGTVVAGDQEPAREFGRTWRSRGTTGIARGLRRRVSRRFARAAPDTSVFELLTGEEIDSVIGVLVADASVLRGLERLVANDPTGATLLRVGGGTGPGRGAAWGERGRATGVSRRALSRLPLLGPSVVVAGPEGAALIDLADLAAARLLILLDVSAPGHRRLEHELQGSPAWSPASDELRREVSGVLAPASSVAVWSRESS